MLEIELLKSSVLYPRLLTMGIVELSDLERSLGLPEIEEDPLLRGIKRICQYDDSQGAEDFFNSEFEKERSGQCLHWIALLGELFFENPTLSERLSPTAIENYKSALNRESTLFLSYSLAAYYLRRYLLFKEANDINNALVHFRECGRKGNLAALMQYIMLKAVSENDRRHSRADGSDGSFRKWASYMNLTYISLVSMGSSLLRTHQECYWRYNDATFIAPRRVKKIDQKVLNGEIEW